MQFMHNKVVGNYLLICAYLIFLNTKAMERRKNNKRNDTKSLHGDAHSAKLKNNLLNKKKKSKTFVFDFVILLHARTTLNKEKITLNK